MGIADLKKIRVSQTHTHINEFNMLIERYDFITTTILSKDEYME